MSSRRFAKLKRHFAGVVLDPFLSHGRLERYLVFLARLVFRIRKPFVIGITGSVGKSTTTATVAAVLSHPAAANVVGRVGHTVSNMNDDVGVAATLLRFDDVVEVPWAYRRRVAFLVRIAIQAIRAALSDYPKVMVLECGAGWTGDLRRIAALAPPDVGVVTRIGAAHLEKLKTLEGVVREKSELVRAVPESGVVILGQGHDYVEQLQQAARARVIMVTGQGTEMSGNIAREICRHMGVPQEVAEAALLEFKRPEGRLNRVDLPGMIVLDDTYNANPLSMQLGLDELAKAATAGQRRVAVLGHMGELGDEADRYHREVGAYARNRADVLIGVGELSKNYDPDHWFATTDECRAGIERVVRPGDCVLVKGSASARMWNVVSELREIAEKRQGAHPKHGRQAASSDLQVSVRTPGLD